MTIFLYQKTHNETGLMYLGKTSNNPFSYKGSGKYWKRHLAKHGKDVSTKILYTSDSLKDIQKVGLYYSKLWNIVESKKWANLVNENGQGFDFMPQKVRQKVSNTMKGRPAPNKGLKQKHKKHRVDGNYNGSNGKLVGVPRYDLRNKARPRVSCITCHREVDVANLSRYHSHF